MKTKTILIITLISFVHPVNAESDDYITGIKLASCAGISKYLAFQLNDNKSYTDAKYYSLKERRYKLAATHSFNKYGMKTDSSEKHASEVMNEEYIALAIQYSDFISRPIGKDPITLRYDNNDSYRIKRLNEITNSSSVSYKSCNALKDTVKSYIKEYRINN